MLKWAELREHLSEFKFLTEREIPFVNVIRDKDLLSLRVFPVIQFHNENGFLDSYTNNVALYRTHENVYILLQYYADDSIGEVEVKILKEEEIKRCVALWENRKLIDAIIEIQKGKGKILVDEESQYEEIFTAHTEEDIYYNLEFSFYNDLYVHPDGWVIPMPIIAQVNLKVAQKGYRDLPKETREEV